MTLQRLIKRQYQAHLDQFQADAQWLQPPSGGWLASMRKLLGMSGAQLARRLKMTRAAVTRAEHAEVSGSISLQTLQHFAEAMGCRVVYTIVPNQSIDSMLHERALAKAKQIVKEASVHMALENQALSKSALQAEEQRLADELLTQKLSKLWDD